MTYGAGQSGYGRVPSWGGGPGHARVDVRPAPKQYGNMAEDEDQAIDPKVLAAEARRLAQERAARGGRQAVSMLWTRAGGSQRVSRPHPPEPPASRKPSGQGTGDGPPGFADTGFADMRFQDPPPEPPAINLGAIDIPAGTPGGWPAPGSDWPSAPPSGPGPTRGGGW